MLLVQLKEMKNFTNHEKDVANYILTHMDEIPDISAGELAKASLTSKATVVRLSQKLGLSGYQELKLKLIAEVNQNERIGQILANEPITPQSSYSDIIHTIPGLYDKAVTNTRLTLNKTDMLRINHFLQEAECIDIYGTGISYTLAQAAAFKFATLGVESSAYESINGHYLAARKHKKTVAFVISFTGANRTVETMAKYLRTATHNHVVGILGPHNQRTRPWCHEVVEIPNRDSILSLDVITSFAASNYVFDIFFSLSTKALMRNRILNRCFTSIGSFFIYFEPTDRNAFCTLYSVKICIILVLPHRKTEIETGGKTWESMMG